MCGCRTECASPHNLRMQFFTTSTHNLLASAAAADVTHYVALSVVGSDRLPESGYLRAKVAQETLIRESSLPYSIVRATQFFEFLTSIAAASTAGNTVRIPPVLFQPLAADDVAKAVAQVAMAAPVNRIVEIAGPESFRFDEFMREGLGARSDPREVVADADARYFGTLLTERSLVPIGNAKLGAIRFRDWLGQSQVSGGAAVR